MGIRLGNALLSLEEPIPSVGRRSAASLGLVKALAGGSLIVPERVMTKAWGEGEDTV